MNLPVLFAFASAGVSALFCLAAPFSKRHTIPKWAFSLGMLALAVEQLLSGLVQMSNNPLQIEDLEHKRFIATALLPGLWLLFSATYSRGNVREALERRLLIIVPAFLAPIGLALLASDKLVSLRRDETQLFSWITTLGWSGFFIHLIFLVSMIGALVGLERTYRASVGTLRWKIKFMLYGLGTLFAARFYTSSQLLLVQQIDPAVDTINAVALLVACLLIARSLLRPGSFEIDLYPSQTVISSSLTITLAGIYLIVVGLLAKVASALGGDQAFAIKTFLILVAVVGLGILIQSDRFRQLIRRFVSRNFQRPLYDYRTLWLKVTEATSQSVRREDICLATTRMLANMLDTKLTNIWLLDTTASQFELIASSDQTANGSTSSLSTPITEGQIPTRLQSESDPFDLDIVDSDWLADIKTSNPSRFTEGGHRILVPLVGHNTPVGFIVLGDRTNTLKFTQQEFDTLKCIADHIAATLLSAELTRKLEQSKEIEAFQTMATFFVHDLKNAVSTLNLMLKNMPQYWDNPEFREDALKGLAGTSQRITQLITRLGQVRKESQIDPKHIDLAELAQSAIDQWHRSDGIEFTERIDGDFPVDADPERIRSGILNLLINASEAMNERGSIELSIARNEQWTELSVKDDGPGMSEAFVRNDLFRPFKTTKKSGLGIGMFQTKMVMEAHGGSIHVESQEGNGATFTLRFKSAN